MSNIGNGVQYLRHKLLINRLAVRLTLLIPYVDRHNRQLRDITFNKVIHYNNMACFEIFAQVKMNSLCIIY